MLVSRIASPSARKPDVIATTRQACCRSQWPGSFLFEDYRASLPGRRIGLCESIQVGLRQLQRHSSRKYCIWSRSHSSLIENRML
jgi:hypothetical protein